MASTTNITPTVGASRAEIIERYAVRDTAVPESFSDYNAVVRGGIGAAAGAATGASLFNFATPAAQLVAPKAAAALASQFPWMPTATLNTVYPGMVAAGGYGAGATTLLAGGVGLLGGAVGYKTDEALGISGKIADIYNPPQTYDEFSSGFSSNVSEATIKKAYSEYVTTLRHNQWKPTDTTITPTYSGFTKSDRDISQYLTPPVSETGDFATPVEVIVAEKKDTAPVSGSFATPVEVTAVEKKGATLTGIENTPAESFKMPTSTVEGFTQEQQTSELGQYLKALKPTYIPGMIQTREQIAYETAVTRGDIGSGFRAARSMAELDPDKRDMYYKFADNVIAARDGVNKFVGKYDAKFADSVLEEEGYLDTNGYVPEDKFAEFENYAEYEKAATFAISNRMRADLSGAPNEYTEFEQGLQLFGVSSDEIAKSTEDYAMGFGAQYTKDAWKNTQLILKVDERGNQTYERYTPDAAKSTVEPFNKVAEADVLLASAGLPKTAAEWEKFDGAQQGDIIESQKSVLAAKIINNQKLVGGRDELARTSTRDILAANSEAERLLRRQIIDAQNKFGNAETAKLKNSTDLELNKYLDKELLAAEVGTDLNINPADTTDAALLQANRYGKQLSELAAQLKEDVANATSAEEIRRLKSAFITAKTLLNNQVNANLDKPTKRWFGTEDTRTGDNEVAWVEKFLPVVSLGMGIYSLTYGKKKDREDALEDQKDLYAWQLQQQLGYQQGLYNINNPTTTDSGDGDSGGGVSYARTDVKVGAL